jgi:BSD domain
MEALLHKLHTHPDRLLADPASHDSTFSSWTDTFSAERHTDEIAVLLDTYPELRSKMDSLVPEKVSYADFWRRYLYLKSEIDADEARRKKLFDNKLDENDFDWEGEDNGEDAASREDFDGKTSTETVKPLTPTASQHAESSPRTSSTIGSTSSFDIVSQSSVVPPTSKVTTTFRTVNIKIEPTTEESDDDWE